MEKVNEFKDKFDEEFANYEKNFYTAFIDIMLEGELWEDAAILTDIAL